MSIKVENPKNPIVLEGLWRLGKTELARIYCDTYGYGLHPEPYHDPGETQDLDSWYTQKHKERELFIRESGLLERSALSAFAFLYALKKTLPHPSQLSSLKERLQEEEGLVVYLKDASNQIDWGKEDVRGYSSDIQAILADPQARARYDEWYTQILPRQYGILPFIARVSTNEGRRPVEDIARDIHLALACRRVAQANVACFSGSGGDIKFLVLKRISKKGGFWQTITGGIHPGEGALEAAGREMYEEIGITQDQAIPFWTPISYSFMGSDDYELDEYVFGCKISDPTAIATSGEHDDFAWLPPAEAMSLIAFEDNKRAIEYLCKKETDSPS
jgi:8-oxo-dGTP pyrophosphatase MutT (NUDIX family)